MSDGGARIVWPKHEKEDLGDIVEALKVVERRVQAQDLSYNI